MKLILCFLGKTREPYLEAGIKDFSNRLGHYAKIEIKTLKDIRRTKGGPDSRFIEQEADILLGAVPKGSLVVALDGSGRQLTSEELAGQLGRWQGEGRKTVSFLIGGPSGLAASVLKTADLVLSLSRMTFTHEMARLIMLEQLYRAYTIMAGEKYHK